MRRHCRQLIAHGLSPNGQSPKRRRLPLVNKPRQTVSNLQLGKPQENSRKSAISVTPSLEGTDNLQKISNLTTITSRYSVRCFNFSGSLGQINHFFQALLGIFAASLLHQGDSEQPPFRRSCQPRAIAASGLIWQPVGVFRASFTMARFFQNFH